MPDPSEDELVQPKRIQVGTTQMTRQEIIEALDDYITEAKNNAAELLGYVSRLPPGPEQAHVVKELQRIQGYLGGVVMPLVRALREDS
jgi:hypothetical protein